MICEERSGPRAGGEAIPEIIAIIVFVHLRVNS